MVKVLFCSVDAPHSKQHLASYRLMAAELAQLLGFPLSEAASTDKLSKYFSHKSKQERCIGKMKSLLPGHAHLSPRKSFCNQQTFVFSAHCNLQCALATRPQRLPKLALTFTVDCVSPWLVFCVSQFESLKELMIIQKLQARVGGAAMLYLSLSCVMLCDNLESSRHFYVKPRKHARQDLCL